MRLNPNMPKSSTSTAFFTSFYLAAEKLPFDIVTKRFDHHHQLSFAVEVLKEFIQPVVRGLALSSIDICMLQNPASLEGTRLQRSQNKTPPCDSQVI